ncbi:MAG TPA: DUF4255 domain-containing protein [Geminicoccaceae bacterium]|nr:DUF4255 domain-containing protein [Geminicoccaceae bacterium]
MAGPGAVLAVGTSLVGHLGRRNELAAPAARAPASFELLGSGQLGTVAVPESRALVTFWLFRIGIDPATRNRPLPPRGLPRTADAEPAFPLGLELHYLVTAWAANALAEHTALAWTMRELHHHPLFEAGTLDPAGEWHADEAVAVVPMELAPEEMMRLWDAIEPAYRLSVAYCARVVRLDRTVRPLGPPVVATRFAFGRLIEELGVEEVPHGR